MAIKHLRERLDRVQRAREALETAAHQMARASLAGSPDGRDDALTRLKIAAIAFSEEVERL